MFIVEMYCFYLGNREKKLIFFETKEERQIMVDAG